MKLKNFSPNLLRLILVSFWKFSKFSSFYEEQIRCDVINLDEIVFFSKLDF